ncbi:MAG: hypothetical protein HYV68_02905, partial [Candidatus Taylorbacteria bacterium]|nr:hypothetical protein [Candidatus Taylorbacteria bacterium]
MVYRKNRFVFLDKLLATLVILALIAPWSTFAASGVPQIISYQGRLTNSGGNLLGSTSGTTYYFKFSIWDNSTVGSGTKLWPSGAPGVTTTTVRSGVFNVNLGDTGNGYPDVLDYNFNSNSAVYLQVEVSADNVTYETLSPRQSITSTSFSELSGAVSGTGQSNFGTTTPIVNAVVTVEATSTASTLITLRGFASQTANLLQAQNAAGSNVFYLNSSGGAFASSTLQVTGATRLYSSLTAEGATFAQSVGVGSTSPWGLLSVNSNTGAPSFVVGSSAGTDFLVAEGGNVGIGTSSPYARLSVAGDVVAARFLATTTSTSSLPRLESSGIASDWLCLASDCRTSWPTGASFGQGWELNSAGLLAPTTTVAIAVGSTATSTFSGGIESGTKIAAPYFIATSSATSTLSGGLKILTGGLTISTANCSGLVNSGKLTTDASGNIICADDTGGGSGSGTVSFGGGGQLAYYTANGTTVAGTSAGLYWNNSNGSLGIGSTTPGGPLAVEGNVIVNNPTGTSTFSGGVEIGALRLNDQVFSGLTGSGLTISSGFLTLDNTGNWAGTWQNYSPASFFNGAFSTTSADYWGAKGTWTAGNFVATTTATSTFSGGLEAGTLIGAPYFNATSTSASSTFQNFGFGNAQGTSLSLSGAIAFTSLTGTGVISNANLANSTISGVA